MLVASFYGLYSFITHFYNVCSMNTHILYFSHQAPQEVSTLVTRFVVGDLFVKLKVIYLRFILGFNRTLPINLIIFRLFVNLSKQGIQSTVRSVWDNLLNEKNRCSSEPSHYGWIVLTMLILTMFGIQILPTCTKMRWFWKEILLPNFRQNCMVMNRYKIMTCFVLIYLDR